jgi:hypothetical protein
VSKELNTLLTALYVLIDDHVVAVRVGRGRAPLLSDHELITLAVGPGVAGVSLPTALDPACPQQRPVAWHVSLPARPVGLPHVRPLSSCYTLAVG